MDDFVQRKNVIEAFDDSRVERYYGDVDPDSVIRIIETIPAANVQPVVTCGECIYAPSGDGQGFDLEWPHDNWPENNPCPWKCEDGWYSHKPKPDFFCANGKREE
jgi:hypothetical protein